MNCSRNTTGPEITYKLVWQDEFEGQAGQLPDSTKWGYDIGTDWGNDQLEYDTDRAENVSLDGEGNLAIIAREESYMGQNYTSARIVTRGKFETTYGRIEARIKLPTGQGIWPAFWMLGSNFETVGWPQCGEIDIMEYRGQEPGIIHGSLHGPGYSGGEALTRRFILENDRFDNDFHIFAVEWQAGVIRWYLDDIQYFTIYPSQVDGEWVFNHAFYIILNIAVGGNYVGPPNATTVFPQTMLIDYVRVYREGN
jgi:beta-glucanase (GH16 family)